MDSTWADSPLFPPSPIKVKVAKEEEMTATGRIFKDPDELVECFGKGWTYGNRPIQINTKYPYKLLEFMSPVDFSVQIDDRASRVMEEQIKAAAKRFGDDISRCFIPHLDMFSLDAPLMLPVMVKSDNGRYYRAEVEAVEGRKVHVFYVDKGVAGEVFTTALYPPSIELLRFPKLAIRCRLAQVVPLRNGQWTNVRDDFKGQESSYFTISKVWQQICHVYLECDNKDVGYEMMMNKGQADLVPLPIDTRHKGIMGKYSRCDYSRWIGQKISAFGCRVSKNTWDGHFKIHLQLDSRIMEGVDELLGALRKDVEGSSEIKNFSKVKGDPVVVEYGNGGELYRATIFEKRMAGYFVKLVDFGDFVTVEEKNIHQITKELFKFPEAAIPCQLAELFPLGKSELTDELFKKVSSLILEKNLYCRIRFSSYIDLDDEQDVQKYLVSLSTEAVAEEPIHQILKLPKIGSPQDFAYEMPSISHSLATILFSENSTFAPGMKFEAYLSTLESYNEVWLHLDGDDVRALELTEELTVFYTNWKDYPKLKPADLVKGTYIGAQQNTEDDSNFYRAQIMDVHPSTNKYTVLFIDYGNKEVVDIDVMRPLPSYFGRVNCFQHKFRLPYELLPGATPDKLFDLALDQLEGACLQVHLRLKHDIMYTDIYKYYDDKKQVMSFAQRFVTENKDLLKFVDDYEDKLRQKLY